MIAPPMKFPASALGYFLIVSSLSSSLAIKPPEDFAFQKKPDFKEDKTEDDKMSYGSWTPKCTDVPQFDALDAAAASFRTDDKLHLRNLCNDSSRCAGLRAEHCDSRGRLTILDYSRQQVTGEVLELLFDLADAVNLVERREAMRQGAKINTTEDRAVLHHCLRMPRGYEFSLRDSESRGDGIGYPPQPTQRKNSETDGKLLLQKIHQVQDKIAAFSDKVRTGEIRGVTGKKLKNFVCIGIGGSQLGADFVKEALRADPDASIAARGRTLRFLSNVDPVE